MISTHNYLKKSQIQIAGGTNVSLRKKGSYIDIRKLASQLFK